MQALREHAFYLVLRQISIDVPIGNRSAPDRPGYTAWRRAAIRLAKGASSALSFSTPSRLSLELQHAPASFHIPHLRIPLSNKAACCGLGTRAAALVIVVNLGVAFYFVPHMAVRQKHVELMLIYLAGFLALMFAGASRFSLDGKFWGCS